MLELNKSPNGFLFKTANKPNPIHNCSNPILMWVKLAFIVFIQLTCVQAYEDYNLMYDSTDGNDDVEVVWNSKASGAEANFIDKYL